MLTIILFIVFISFLYTSSIYGENTSFNFVEKMFQGVVIWNMDHPKVNMPKPTENQLANNDYIGYASENPIAVLELGIIRIIYETIQIRPWYSTVFNLYIAIFMFFFF
jgi:hypothetical protein